MLIYPLHDAIGFLQPTDFTNYPPGRRAAGQGVRVAPPTPAANGETMNDQHELRQKLFQNARAEVDALARFGVKLSSPDQQLEVAALVRRLELMLTLLEHSEAPRSS
jgi:hypothetical protein